MPSGTLWATCNIGANSPEEAGLYFAWGETSGYTAEQVGVDKYFIFEDYTDESGVTHHNDYKFGPVDWSDESNYGMTKYNETDGKAVLDAEDDAATANWDSNWKMPTKEQFEELTANTEYEWTEIDGVQGGKFTSTVSGYTGKFLFFPAVGRAVDGGVGEVADYGYNWAASLETLDGVHYAYYLYFYDGFCAMYSTDCHRCYGLPVRPVRSK